LINRYQVRKKQLLLIKQLILNIKGSQVLPFYRMFYLICGLFELETGSFGISFIGYSDGDKLDRALIGFNIYGASNMLDIKVLFLNIKIS